MNFNIEKYIKEFDIPYKNGKKIGWFRGISAIFGALFISYFALLVILKVIFEASSDAIIIPLLVNTLSWPCVSIWIFLSRSNKVVFLRTYIPSFIIGIMFIFLIV